MWLLIAIGVVVFEATLVTKSFRLPNEHSLLVRAGRVVGWLVAAWLVFRFAGIGLRGALPDAFDGHRVVPWFWIENALGAIAALMFLLPGAQKSERNAR